MLSINTNLSSLIAQNSMKTSTDKLNQAIERMTTGFKINHAKDNAANYSISTDMTTKIGAYQVAEDNCAQGLDMITTASESLSLIQDKLERLRALATQASNGTYGAQSLKAINAEANALVDEIERQYNTTEYNGINLAKGKVISTEESKFIKDIDRRDTSKMTTLASVDPTEKLEYGTYSISTADELAKLATMTNNGLIGASCEFVLGADIDLSGIANWTPIGWESLDNPQFFYSSFDGNGYIISNLKIDETKGIVGLFGTVTGGSIKNLGITDANIITGGNHAGILSGSITDGTSIDNCYVNGNVEGNRYIAGFVAYVRSSNIKNAYSEVSVNAIDTCAGFSSNVIESIIENCCCAGSVIASIKAGGGFVFKMSDGFSTYFGQTLIRNCYSSCDVSSNTYAGTFVGEFAYGNLENCYSTGEILSGSGDFCGYDPGGGKLINCSKLSALDTAPFEITNNASINMTGGSLNLQVGVNSDTTSQIVLSLGVDILGIESLRRLDNLYDSFSNNLGLIDSILSKVSSKQTELGAVQNRLESALDEISIKYENLVSSRSTLRDADIAKVSSTYIQQQILQQASATLVATANQSPAIALQLI